MARFKCKNSECENIFELKIEFGKKLKGRCAKCYSKEGIKQIQVNYKA